VLCKLAILLINIMILLLLIFAYVMGRVQWE